MRRITPLDGLKSFREIGSLYLRMPAPLDAPVIGDFEEFVAAMDRRRDDRVAVHSGANHRVSCFVALYGQLRWGWTSLQADRLIQEIWTPNDTSLNFVRLARVRFGLSRIAGDRDEACDERRAVGGARRH